MKKKNYYDYGQTLELLQIGNSMRRKAWEEGKFITMQMGTRVPSDVIPKMTSLSNTAKDILISRNAQYIEYKEQILLVNAKNQATNYIPSMEDTFAPDWEIMEY